MQISLTTSSPRLFNRKFWWRITFLFFTHYHPPKPKQKFIFNCYKLKTNLQTETFLENHVSNQISFGHGQGAPSQYPNINPILGSLHSYSTDLMLVLFAGICCPWWNYLDTFGLRPLSYSCPLAKRMQVYCAFRNVLSTTDFPCEVDNSQCICPYGWPSIRDLESIFWIA